MSAGWNISLFHYRNHGADYGRVLVGYAGCRRPTSAISAAFSTGWAIRLFDETANPAYRLFLGR